MIAARGEKRDNEPLPQGRKRALPTIVARPEARYARGAHKCTLQQCSLCPCIMCTWERCYAPPHDPTKKGPVFCMPAETKKYLGFRQTRNCFSFSSPRLMMKEGEKEKDCERNVEVPLGGTGCFRGVLLRLFGW